jgi:uncharacterized phage protein (TIGR01671 family)
MREIKFRIWDELSKKMYYEIQLIKKDDGFWWTYENGAILMGSNSDRRHLMQFTGLLDCNGKEIYEGDIIKYGFKSIKYANGPFIGKVFMSEYMWCVDGDTDNDEIHSINRISGVEIIGNIYESKP